MIKLSASLSHVCIRNQHKPSFLLIQKLTDIKGLSEAKIEKMVEAAKKVCPAQYAWQSAREVEHQVLLVTYSQLHFDEDHFTTFFL